MDRYARINVIGRGATSVVYRAHDTLLDRSVALKELQLLDSVDIALEEARAVARIVHPNVVTVHDVFAVEGRPVIAMELLEGPTLRDVLSASGILPLEQALIICGHVAHSLMAAHAVGIVHRDIKPDNVFVVSGGRVVVTDFGMALASLRGGTPGYMAPEQADGAVPAPACDVYSWACMLVECVTGRPPFGDDDDYVVRSRSGVTVDLGWASLDVLVTRCLDPRPRTRPADAGALVGELAALGWPPPAVASESEPGYAGSVLPAASSGLSLVAHGPDGAAWPVRVPPEGLDIGREGDVSLEDPLLSRRHVRVAWEGAGWVVRDLGSLNGTTVNGVPVSASLLCPGDLISVGQYLLRVEG